MSSYTPCCGTCDSAIECRDGSLRCIYADRPVDFGDGSECEIYLPLE